MFFSMAKMCVSELKQQRGTTNLHTEWVVDVTLFSHKLHPGKLLIFQQLLPSPHFVVGVCVLTSHFK